MTPEEAITIWSVLGAANTGRQLTAEELATRAELILDLDGPRATAAAKVWAQDQKWFPSVAEFREAALDPGILESGEVWAELIAYVHAHGWDEPPGVGSFSHPVALAAARAMGDWQDFCAGDVIANRAHFLKLYPEIRDRFRRMALVDPAVAAALEAARRVDVGRGYPPELTGG